MRLDSPSNPVSLRTIFLAFLQIGLTAYGMAILQKLRALVIRRGWLTEEETSEGLAMVQLYPGAVRPAGSCSTVERW
jgi:chromate transport protein ChrA